MVHMDNRSLSPGEDSEEVKAVKDALQAITEFLGDSKLATDSSKNEMLKDISRILERTGEDLKQTGTTTVRADWIRRPIVDRFYGTYGDIGGKILEALKVCD